jgi:tetratricopeptide (TPR) repeat protein
MLGSLSLVLGGCSSTPSAGADYLTAYNNRDYPRAYKFAEDAAARSSGLKREQASLIAGLSAHALNRTEDAQKWLEPLAVTAKDDQISGRAGATLGIIAAEKKQHETAVRYLTEAAAKLDGNDAARAWLYAGDSYKALNKAKEARDAYAKAESLVTDGSDLESMARQRIAAPIVPQLNVAPYRGAIGAGPPPGARYTVQMGAFSTRANAEDAARRTGRPAMAIGQPYIVQTTSKAGKPVFALRVGGFATADQARKAAQDASLAGAIPVPVR